ncbi:Uu.00g075290.m01.CDS01 [Anthostomella pinea]|uniref:Uu.00g075290.m01.CDS01 n=1 Tax=Anthostomella pinea TaxID=933095 RepID=A0AAI8VVM8_9PEZI|nr:Uu.00g075290.m01.CDS01 [Anthostomella pinea]
MSDSTTTSSPSSDFDSSFNDAQDTFNNTTKTITTGWIVGIVIICVAVISLSILAFIVYRRNQRRRRAREGNVEKYNAVPTYTYGNQAPAANAYPQSLQPNAYPEMAGSNPPSRYEVPNTEMAYREAPNCEVAVAHQHSSPTYTSPRPELSGNDSRRSELPV